MFTHCLLRAFEQPPTKDGWLTISQIQNFVSSDISWFAKDQPIQIQAWSVYVNPNLPLLRNPGYPELCPTPPLWNVPLRRNPFFTGQEDLLARLATLLQSDQKTALTQPQAISGLGGIGKTQLALEYAYRHRQDYHAVLWSSADTREGLISTFVTMAHLLDLPQKDEQDQLITVEAVKAWLAGRSNCLFVLDNADELAMVKEFIPPAFQGHMLLTTRAQVMGGLAHKIEVETMRPETGALLLLRRAGLLAPGAPLEQAAAADVTLAKELSEEMGGLPLALDQAGAYIEAVACSLQDYQRLYQTHRAELLKERGGVVPDHPESVATTWSLAFQKVKQSNPAASDLLRLCAFLHPDAIPEEIITKGAEYLDAQLQATARDPLALNKAIMVLRAYSLVSRDSTTHTLTIHRLVQAVLKESMDEQSRREWAKRTVRAVNLAFPDVADIALWEQCERYLPHALVCATLIGEYTLAFPEVARLLNQTAYYLYSRAQYPQAEPLYQRALAIREQQLGPEHPDTALSLNNLAELHRAQGKYEQAEPLYQRALAIRERQLEPEHPDTATSLNNLALLYYTQGKYEKAEPLYQRALPVMEKQLGPEHPHTAESLNNLALLYHAQGKYEKAEPLYQRALDIHERVLGPEHPYTAQSLNNLAELYYTQGKYEKAEPLLQRALAIRERQLEPEHPDTAESLNNLAGFYHAQGKYEKAEPLIRRALAIYERVLGPEHPHAARSLNNLAGLYYSQGKYEKAEPLIRRALAIYEKQLGPEHPTTVTIRENCNVLARDMKQKGKGQH
jgi:tetratricopeptide (TPR) repeat protein